MKIYKIEFNSCSYDEYDSFIVRAENKESVETLVRKEHPEEKWARVQWEKGFVITEIPLEGKEEILLGSFNAG